LLRDRDFLLVSFVTFGIFFTRTGTHNQLIPLLGVDRLGLSISKIGLALTLIAVTQIGALLLAGTMAAHWERKKLITPGCLLLGLGLVVAAMSSGYTLFIVSCIVMGFGIGLAGPILSAYVADILPKEEYGIGMGLYRTVSDFGFVTGPVLLGWMADLSGFTLPILFNAALILLTALLFFFWAREPSLRRRDKPREGEQGALAQERKTPHELYAK
jgi:MFS family permease